MYKYLVVLSAALTQDTQNTLLGKLGEYGIMGIVLAVMLWKDYKNEAFLQGLIGDLKESLDKLSDKIENKLQ
jgi:hypothetical protein